MISFCRRRRYSDSGSHNTMILLTHRRAVFAIVTRDQLVGACCERSRRARLLSSECWALGRCSRRLSTARAGCSSATSGRAKCGIGACSSQPCHAGWAGHREGALAVWKAAGDACRRSALDRRGTPSIGRSARRSRANRARTSSWSPWSTSRTSKVARASDEAVRVRATLGRIGCKTWMCAGPKS